MQLVAPQPYDVAIQKLGARSPVGSLLNSTEWRDVPVALRETAFFSSQVENVRFLQRAKDTLTDYLAGAKETVVRPDGTTDTVLKTGSRAAFVEQLRRFAQAEGMGPLRPQDAGTIKDITAENRLALIFDTQTKAARDFGNWKQGMDPAVLDEFPAQRFIRVRRVKKPRPYHQAALGTVRLKTDTAYWVGLNPDFGVPWGPWGYRSGCDVEDQDRATTERLGLLRPGQKVRPVDKKFTENLQASLRGLDQALVDKLQQVFGAQASVTNGAIHWTDQAPPPLPKPPRVRKPKAPAAPPVPVGPPEVPFQNEVAWRTGTPAPGQLGGVEFAPVPKGWWDQVKDVDVHEPAPLRKIDRAGILVREADGRVWIVEPTNHFGNREHTLPGGGVERGLTVQQNAMKEVWEETGLKVRITGYLGDFRDSNNGNNGRLYLGERVGGAPWDAKIESFIRDAKTGKPAAESESVKLVTLDRAAQLLHRTDDQAQLMTLRPIPVNTPTSGKGSEPLKKFLEGIQPRAKAYEAETTRAGAYHGNAQMHEISEIRGYNAKPELVSAKEFDRRKAAGEIDTEMLRGMAGFGSKTGEDFADQFRTGDHFAGHGIFGSGDYADSSKGYHNVAGQYAGHGGAVIRLGLRKGAKVINIEDLERQVPAQPASFKGYPRGKLAVECYLGMQAALAGYDAIYITGRSRRHPGYGKGFYVILNRAAVVVQQNSVPRTYKIK